MQEELLTSRQVAERLGGVTQDAFNKFWQVCKKHAGKFPEPKSVIGRNQFWAAAEIDR